jgi:hypothetical protein
MKLHHAARRNTCCLPLCGGTGSVGHLPESEIALLRSDIQTKKTRVLQQNLILFDGQATNFWPLQRSYENDLSKLRISEST